MEPLTQEQIDEVKRRDARRRCKCGEKIELYSADLSWCPKCREQCEHVPNGPTDLEVHAIAEIESLRQQLAAVTAERDRLQAELSAVHTLRTMNDKNLNVYALTPNAVCGCGEPQNVWDVIDILAKPYDSEGPDMQGIIGRGETIEAAVLAAVSATKGKSNGE